MNIEIGSKLRPHAYKNHDRIVAQPDLAAVLDGAGHFYASELARSIFIGQSKLPLPELFGKAQEVVCQDFNGNFWTTATAVKLHDRYFDYAHAGDSRLYMFLERQRQLLQITADESQHDHDAHNFLGNPRHILRQYGSVPVIESVKLLLVTDGITDIYDRFGRVSDDRLAEVLAEDFDPNEAAQSVIDASNVQDDASAIVVNINV